VKRLRLLPAVRYRVSFGPAEPRGIRPSRLVRPGAERSGSVSSMANGRLRSISTAPSAAVAPLSDEEELVRKLRDGEIDKEQYYEASVERSISRLRGIVPPDQLEVVRETLREEVESNPVLIKMLQDALAQLPGPGPR